MTFPIEFRWRDDPPEDFGIPYRQLPLPFRCALSAMLKHSAYKQSCCSRRNQAHAFNHHEVFGWTLMIDVSGYAPTDQEARESWTEAMALLENIFIEISADKADQLTSGETTIS